MFTITADSFHFIVLKSYFWDERRINWRQVSQHETKIILASHFRKYDEKFDSNICIEIVTINVVIEKNDTVKSYASGPTQLLFFARTFFGIFLIQIQERFYENLLKRTSKLAPKAIWFLILAYGSSVVSRIDLCLKLKKVAWQHGI